MTTRIRGRGQMTIPANLRKELGLQEDDAVSLVKVGEALLLVPRPLRGDQVAREYDREMKLRKVSLNDLLKDLRKTRRTQSRRRNNRF